MAEMLNKTFSQGVAELEKLNYSIALNHFNKYILYYKENYLAYFFRGYALLSTLTIRKDRGEKLTYTDFRPAIEDLSNAIDLNPVFADGYYYRGLALYMVSDDNDFSASRKSLEKAYELGHNDAKYHLDLLDAVERELMVDNFVNNLFKSQRASTFKF